MEERVFRLTNLDRPGISSIFSLLILILGVTMLTVTPGNLEAQEPTEELTPRQIGEIAGEIRRNPDRQDEILDEHGLTEQQFRDLVWEVSLSPQSSDAYRRGYSMRIMDYLARDRWTFSADGSHSNLDADLPGVSFDDWNSQSVSGSYIYAPAKGVFLSATRIDWFDQDDTVLEGNWFTRLSRRTRVSIFGSHSPTHEVSAEFGLGGQISYWLGSGFELEAGGSVNDYDQTLDTRQFRGTLRYYMGNNYWASYSAVANHIGSTGPEYNNRVTLGYHSGVNVISITGFSGDSLVQLQANPPVIGLTDSDGGTLRGQLKVFNSDFYPLLTFNLDYEDIQFLYDRTTLGLGLKWQFR